MVTERLGELFSPYAGIYIDTSLFIYFIEQHQRYFAFCDQLFRLVEEGRLEAFTSTLTLTEILLQPYRQKNAELVLKFYSLFTTYPHLTWVPMTLPVSDLAARLRAEHNLKTPDAIHAATALSSGAGCIVCNDQAFRRVEGIRSLLIEEWL